MTLREFVGSICGSVNRAQSALSNYRLDYMRTHMEEQDDGSMTPKMIDITVGEETVSVPQYTLCQSNDLNLENVIVKGHAEITGFTDPINTLEEDHQIIVKPCAEGHRNCFEIQLKFSATPDLESENLLVERLNAEMSK